MTTQQKFADALETFICMNTLSESVPSYDIH